MMNDFAERLKHFRSKANLTQTQFAQKVGISQKQVSDYEVGLSKPRMSTFYKILDALQIAESEFNDDSYQELESENTYIIGTKSSGSIAISSKIMHRLKSAFEKLDVFEVKGDSMSPTLKDGDLALVNLSRTTLLDNHIYVFEISNEKVFARLLKEADGTITLARDNPQYRGIKANIADLNVIGEVVYRQGFI